MVLVEQLYCAKMHLNKLLSYFHAMQDLLNKALTRVGRGTVPSLSKATDRVKAWELLTYKSSYTGFPGLSTSHCKRP